MFTEKQTSATSGGTGGPSNTEDSCSTSSENWSQHEQARAFR